MSDISQLDSRVGGEGKLDNKLPISSVHYPVPGSGRGAGRAVAFPPLGLDTNNRVRYTGTLGVALLAVIAGSPMYELVELGTPGAALLARR
jgi:hypothetical protein